MALTDAQKSDARQYLGYPDNFRQENTRLESVLANLSPTGEAQAVALLANIASIDVAVGTAMTTKGGLKKVDEVEWYADGVQQKGPVGFAIGRGRQFITRLSVLVGCPVYGDFFGSYGYPGDNFSDGGIPGNKFSTFGGGAYPLG